MPQPAVALNGIDLPGGETPQLQRIYAPQARLPSRAMKVHENAVVPTLPSA